MPDLPDERLLAARDLAVAALREITPAESIGAPAGHLVEPDGVVSLLFATRLEGYPGWYWTVSLAVVDDAEPTVLEAELLPGDGALLAPEWVPWAVRLADYRTQQAVRAAEEAEGVAPDADDLDPDDSDDLDPDDSDDLDEDDDDLDEDEDDVDELDLGSDDVDGVNIDDFDEPQESAERS